MLLYTGHLAASSRRREAQLEGEARAGAGGGLDEADLANPDFFPNWVHVLVKPSEPSDQDEVSSWIRIRGLSSLLSAAAAVGAWGPRNGIALSKVWKENTYN